MESETEYFLKWGYRKKTCVFLTVNNTNTNLDGLRYARSCFNNHQHVYVHVILDIMAHTPVMKQYHIVRPALAEAWILAQWKTMSTGAKVGRSQVSLPKMSWLSCFYLLYWYLTIEFNNQPPNRNCFLSTLQPVEPLLLIVTPSLKRPGRAKYHHSWREPLTLIQSDSSWQQSPVSRFLAGIFWCCTPFSKILILSGHDWVCHVISELGPKQAQLNMVCTLPIT